MKLFRDKARQYLVDEGYQEQVSTVESAIGRFYTRCINQQIVEALVRDGRPDGMADEQYEDCMATVNSPAVEPDISSLSTSIPFPFSQVAVSFAGLQTAIGLEVFRRRIESITNPPTDDLSES